ncbi:MAG: aminotransferase class IV, partial [Halomonas sp.]|nr:aminotransferase class IV [Halomonas sp.]
GLHVLKLILTRGSGGRGYCAPATSEPRLLWKSAPFSPHPRRWQEGVQVRLCELRLGIQPRLAGLKHLNRLENVLARQEWDDDRIAEGLLCDTEDRLVETTSMNLFWLREGRFETPRLDRCGVAGTLRAALQEIMPIAEVSHGMEALGEAQALWLGNSVQGVWPVASVESADGMLLHTWNPSDHSRDFQNIANELLGYPRLD